MPSTKKCNTCEAEKELSEYRPGRARCIVCDREISRLRAKEDRKNNPEKYRESNRKRYLKKVGGVLGRKIGAVIRTEDGKACSHCKVIKTWENFSKEKKSKDGHCYFCKECNKERKEKYLSSYKGKITDRNYKIIHKDVQRKAAKKYLDNNKEKLSEYKKNNYTLEDRRRWRKSYEDRKSTPGAYVIWEGKKAEVLSEHNGAIRISLLSNRKQVVTYKSYLRLWKNPLTY